MSDNANKPRKKKPSRKPYYNPQFILVEVDGDKGDFTRRPMSEEKRKYYAERGWLPAPTPAEDEENSETDVKKE